MWRSILNTTLFWYSCFLHCWNWSSCGFSTYSNFFHKVIWPGHSFYALVTELMSKVTIETLSKYFKILKLPHWQRLQCGEYYICNNFNCTSISFGKIYNDGKQKISWWWWKVNKKSIKIAFREHNILGVFFNHKINRFVPTYNKENVKIFISLANIVCTCVNSVLISCPLNSSLTISWPILYRSISSFWKVKFLTLHTLGINTIPQSVNFILVW